MCSIWKENYTPPSLFYRAGYAPKMVCNGVIDPDIYRYIHIYIGEKQWQTTPKNLPRMQRIRAIPVAWLGSGSCPDWPMGWILIIKIIYMYIYIGGKQWQTTPKNLPRMQRIRAIPAAWLGSGSCPYWPMGWILIIKKKYIYIYTSIYTYTRTYPVNEDSSKSSV
jgi:hypothetical protein